MDSLTRRSRWLDPLLASSTILLLLVSGLTAFFNLTRLWRDAALVEHTQEVLNALETVVSLIKDAETGQRGYLISGDDEYLEPYNVARAGIDQAVKQLKDLTIDNLNHQGRIPALQDTIARKWTHLNEAIELRRTDGFEAAQANLMNGQGKAAMDSIREQVNAMRLDEQKLLALRHSRSDAVYQTALTTTLISTTVGLTLLGTVMYVVQQRRKRAESDAALIYQEGEKLRVTLSSIGDGVITCDAQGKVRFLNGIAEMLIGWKLDEARGEPLETVFHIINEDSRQLVENPAFKALREGNIVGLANHTLLIAKDGTECPIDDSAAPIRDLAGRVDGVVLVFRNVKERRDEENRVRAAAQLTEGIVDGLNEYVIVLDEERNLLYANQAFLSAFDLSRIEALGISIDELASGVWNVPVLHRLLNQIPEVKGLRRELEFEDIVRNQSRTFRATGSRFDAGAKYSNCILLLLSDVTDARRLELSNRQLDQQMRWFLEQIQDHAIFMIDTDFKITTWNRGVEQVLGYKEDEFVNQDVRELIFTPEAIADGTVASEFEIAASSGHASDDRWMLAKGNRRFWASGITSDVRDAAGNLIGYSKVMRDLTLRKRAQDDLAELAAKLSEEGRRKNEFLATLAHELRNPLAPIKNAVQLMAMLNLNNDVEDLRQTMARQVEQLVRLIDDLLDVSRISRGKVTLRKQIVDLQSIVDAAVESSQGLIDDNGQELIVRVTSGLTVEADPARLTQVISNLLNNSAKYSSAGCTVELTAEAIDGRANIRVKDNGIGIESSRLEEIFQLFSQINNSLERGTAGLGIGLTLVKTLVELHGGTVKAESDGPGCGSVFTVALPLTAQSATVAIDTRPVIDPASIPGYKVMVVEDMRALSMVLARLLEKLGHEVEVVDNGPAALQRLDSYQPDVIFSDISMPGMTGYELAQRLRLRPETSKTLLVAMTGYGQATDREKALQAGFDDHLVKPVDVAQLQKVFSEWVLKTKSNLS